MSKKTYEIAVTPRSEKGSSAVRRARKTGLVPAVIYSKGKPGEMIYVKASAWQAAARHDVNLIALKGEGIDKLAAVKEVQFNTMKNSFIHIDFNEVASGEKMHGIVLIHAKYGDIPAGTANGGVLEQDLHELEVRCFPQDLPESIEVSVAALEIGDKITVQDLKLPAEIEAMADAGAVVFHLHQPRIKAETDSETPVEEPKAVEKKKKEDA